MKSSLVALLALGFAGLAGCNRPASSATGPVAAPAGSDSTAAIAPPSAAAQTNLCERSEVSYFACQVKGGKLVSVCGSKDLTSDHGYLQYRFGTAQKIEQQFPSDRTAGVGGFKAETLSGDEGQHVERDLSFTAGNADYTVYSQTGPAGDKTTGSGVTIEKAGDSKSTSLDCSGTPSVDKLDELDGVVSSEVLD